VGVVVVGVPTLLILGLLVWDGGFAVDKDRVLMPGVELHLRTAATKQGPVEYDMYGQKARSCCPSTPGSAALIRAACSRAGSKRTDSGS
jgi:hypothetical protein